MTQFKAQIRIAGFKNSSWVDCPQLGTHHRKEELARSINKLLLLPPKNGIYELKLGKERLQYRIVPEKTESGAGDWSVDLQELLEEWLNTTV